jgi:uncharacterized protein YndB with AHSA1/START domain
MLNAGGEAMAYQAEAGAIIWKMHFLSPVERIYDFLATDPGRAQFWAEASHEEDGYITFEFLNRPGMHRGKVLQAKKPRVFSVEYFKSQTTFELKDDGKGGTDLKLTASGVPEEMHMEMTAGWVSVLMALKAAADYGVDLRNHDMERTWDQGYADN